MPELKINTTAAQAARISAAFGTVLGTKTEDDPPVPRDASAAEIKAHVIQFIKETVLRVERNEAGQAARKAVPDINPS